MEIKTYNSSQLNDLINSGAFRTMPVIPISTHRAISHIHNPRADREDTLMIIAYEDNEMVGYLGVLADRIYTLSGEALKCGWLSCMWVNPALRGKGIAKQLLATAFKTWNDHILVTEFTPEAKGLYDRSGGFNDLRVNEGLRCYLRFNLHEVLPKKGVKYKKYEPLLRIADMLANVPNSARLLFHNPKPNSRLQFEVIKQIDNDLDSYIRSKSKNSFERRTADDLHWITSYPWLVESPATEESKRYHFSSVADKFLNTNVKIKEGNRTVGYLLLTIRDSHLKVPYAYFEPEITKDVVQYIYGIMMSEKLNMLTIFHKDIVDHISSHSTPFIYQRHIRRRYIISKALDSHFSGRERLEIQDGDADCAFT
jgi:GNAT superfamily N-acetyltransferase